ncbi:hypothetical protein CN204_32535 [Sinorhizobium meliloti]|nr:hypothetical protein [Sinorhizobium meliloti]PST26060.1 hypothetical protein C7U62_12850 [Mesorhizobium loti]ARS72095.1 hypothetical protein SMRU11_35125 [Sinorhizobium meliloti RU11/001]ASP51397.1 hypothetical protein CDO31_07325 [Sinorhizobium meliloti]MBP2467302.1 hypothetical protein [Sinorhizobium meliloti]MDE3766306.1 hypothetical protein [Sinorhizobium meliloti]
MIKLGSFAKDCITNFAGVVTGHAEYITGCDQYLLSPRNPDKEPKWFDGQRLAVDPIIAPIAIDNSNGAGADIPAPVK